MRTEVRLEQFGSSVRVGALLDSARRIHFEYDRSFLATGLELSPLRLPLKVARGGERKI